VVRFIHSRFREYRRRKTDNRHWDEAGRILWERFDDSGSVEAFCSGVGQAFHVDAA
jgi:hypothetical protein